MTLQLFALTIFVLSYSDLIFAFPADLKIINGSNASIADHPWMVSLFDRINIFECGGFLISPSWVVTAGHCVIDTITHIRGGSSKLLTGGIWVETDKIIPHPEYDADKARNDIALIRLKTPLIGENIEPIPLPEQDTELTEGDIVNIAGWGMIDFIHKLDPETLQELNISIVGFDTCRESFKGTRCETFLTEKVLCAGSGKPLTGVCFGDSGSALVWNGKAVGIPSFMVDSCASPKPTGFTKVSKYVDWIHNIISANI